MSGEYVFRGIARCAAIALVVGLASSALSRNVRADSACAPDDRKCENEEIKKMRDEVFKPVDPAAITEVTVETPKKAMLGSLTFEGADGKPGLQKVVKDGMRAILRKRNADTYRGMRTNVAAGVGGLSAVPVCNIMHGEGEDIGQPGGKNKNWLPEKSSASSCGQVCGMQLEVGEFSGTFKLDDEAGHCDWEYGQYRGAVVQSIAYFRDQVFQEFDQKKVKLISIDGERPCAEVAADLTRVQKAVLEVNQEVVDLHGGNSAEVEKIDCPMVKADEANKANEIANDADKKHKALAKQELAETMANPASQGACHMMMANLNLRLLWTEFLDCEIYWRSGKVFEEKFGSPDNFVNQVKAAVKPKCGGAASCEDMSGNKACSGLFCCTDSLRTKLFNECYKKVVPGVLKQRVQEWPGEVDLPKNPPAAESKDKHSSNNLPTGHSAEGHYLCLA